MAERTIRRKDRQLSQEEALDILKQGTYGILSVVGDEGWPYAVPMHYIYLDGAIYLHCGKKGHMVESLAKDERVCFTVVTQHELVSDQLTALYESVIVFGQASLVEEESQRQTVLEALVDILGEVSPEIKAQYIQRKGDKTGLVCIRPTQVTGKASRKYVPVTQRM